MDFGLAKPLKAGGVFWRGGGLEGVSACALDRSQALIRMSLPHLPSSMPGVADWLN